MQAPRRLPLVGIPILDGVLTEFDATAASDGSFEVIARGAGNGMFSFVVNSDADTPATALSVILSGSFPTTASASFTLPGLGPQILPINETVNISGVVLSSSMGNDFIVELSDLGTGDSFLFSTDITAVPLPAAAWLFISALGGLFVARRRRLALAA